MTDAVWLLTRTGAQCSDWPNVSLGAQEVEPRCPTRRI